MTTPWAWHVTCSPLLLCSGAVHDGPRRIGRDETPRVLESGPVEPDYFGDEARFRMVKQEHEAAFRRSCPFRRAISGTA